MIKRVLACIWFIATATAAAASPCVSPTFDIPLPGATQVTSHVTDVPSSAFPAFWQEGRVDGYSYQIFANATGVLRGDGQGQPWAIDVICDATAGTCAFAQTGTPPPSAIQVADRIGQCLVPVHVLLTEAKDVPPQVPQTERPLHVTQDRPDNTVIKPGPAPCGLALIDEATDVATMQRLLVLLDQDPGPVDGFLGPKTFVAMASFVDNPGWETSIPDLIAVLSQQHCVQSQ